MAFFRRTLTRLAIACLLGQVSTLAAVPVALFDDTGTGVVACTCSHGDHATCPMHHRSPAPRCAMRGAPDTATVVISALFGLPGVMPAADAVLLPAVDSITFATATVSPIPRATTPDAPPPRG